MAGVDLPVSIRAGRVALVSTAEAREQDQDLPPLLAAFEDAGLRATIADWDDAAVDWSRFNFALIRSPWNYMQHLDAFLAWADRAAAVTTVLNPPELIRWNTDKSYLLDLAARGVPTPAPGRSRIGRSAHRPPAWPGL
jgi:hypothetical protein